MPGTGTVKLKIKQNLWVRFIKNPAIAGWTFIRKKEKLYGDMIFLLGLALFFIQNRSIECPGVLKAYAGLLSKSYFIGCAVLGGALFLGFFIQQWYQTDRDCCSISQQALQDNQASIDLTQCVVIYDQPLGKQIQRLQSYIRESQWHISIISTGMVAHLIYLWARHGAASFFANQNFYFLWIPCMVIHAVRWRLFYSRQSDLKTLESQSQEPSKTIIDLSKREVRPMTHLKRKQNSHQNVPLQKPDDTTHHLIIQIPSNQFSKKLQNEIKAKHQKYLDQCQKDGVDGELTNEKVKKRRKSEESMLVLSVKDMEQIIPHNQKPSCIQIQIPTQKDRCFRPVSSSENPRTKILHQLFGKTLSAGIFIHYFDRQLEGELRWPKDYNKVQARVMCLTGDEKNDAHMASVMTQLVVVNNALVRQIVVMDSNNCLDGRMIEALKKEFESWDQNQNITYEIALLPVPTQGFSHDCPYVSNYYTYIVNQLVQMLSKAQVSTEFHMPLIQDYLNKHHSAGASRPHQRYQDPSVQSESYHLPLRSYVDIVNLMGHINRIIEERKRNSFQAFFFIDQSTDKEYLVFLDQNGNLDEVSFDVSGLDAFFFKSPHIVELLQEGRAMSAQKNKI